MDLTEVLFGGRYVRVRWVIRRDYVWKREGRRVRCARVASPADLRSYGLTRSVIVCKKAIRTRGEPHVEASDWRCALVHSMYGEGRTRSSGARGAATVARRRAAAARSWHEHHHRWLSTYTGRTHAQHAPALFSVYCLCVCVSTRKKLTRLELNNCS